MIRPARPSLLIGLLVIPGMPAAIAAEDPMRAAFDHAWSLVKLYENPDNPVLQKLAFTGRMQFDYAMVNGTGSQAAGINDDISFDYGGLRRLRGGLKATLFEDFTVQVEGDFDYDEDPFYRRLTDAYIDWKASDAFSIRAGKQGMGFTLDGNTSSKELLTIDRNNLSNNLWFTSEYAPGLSFTGKHGRFGYHAGVFSQGIDDGEFGDFSAGTSWLASVGYDFSSAAWADKADLRLDYVYNEETPTAGLFTNRALEQVVSLNFRYERGAFGLRGDLAAAEGYLNQPDLKGFVVMPYYNFSDKLQGVLRYTYIHSSRNDGIRFARYEAPALNERRGDEYQEAYAGLNYYIYGHKLKLQTGIQYVTMRDQANNGGAFDGWSWTTGLRISW